VVTVITVIMGTTVIGITTGTIVTIDTATDSALARSVLESPC